MYWKKNFNLLNLINKFKIKINKIDIDIKKIIKNIDTNEAINNIKNKYNEIKKKIKILI